MTDSTRRLLEEALPLPLPERAELAAEILASMHGLPESDVEAAWAAELDRRIQRHLEDPARGRGWPSVRAEIEQTLRNR